MHNNLNKRLETLETQAIAAQRSTVPGLVALLERGLLTMTDLTDGELAHIVAMPLLGDAGIDWHALTDEQVERLAAGADLHWVLGGKG